MDTLIILGASYLYLLVIGVAVITFFASPASIRVKLFKLAILVLPLSYIIATALGYVIASPRPFLVEQVQPLIPSAIDNGFPSDHTLLAAAIAAVLVTYRRRVGSVLLLCAVLIGIARILAHVHHPIDVVGSLVIAIVTTILVYKFAVDRLPPKTT